MKSILVVTGSIIWLAGFGCTIAAAQSLATPGLNCGTLLGQTESQLFGPEPSTDCENPFGTPSGSNGGTGGDGSSDALQSELEAIFERYERERQQVRDEFAAERAEIEAEKRAIAERMRQIDEELARRAEQERSNQQVHIPRSQRDANQPSGDAEGMFYELQEGEAIADNLGRLFGGKTPAWMTE